MSVFTCMQIIYEPIYANLMICKSYKNHSFLIHSSFELISLDNGITYWVVHSKSCCHGKSCAWFLSSPNKTWQIILRYALPVTGCNSWSKIFVKYSSSLLTANAKLLLDKVFKQFLPWGPSLIIILISPLHMSSSHLLYIL